MEPRVEEFTELFGDFMRSVLEAEPKKEPPFRVLLREHLEADPTELPVVGEQVPTWDHANLQVALEALFAREGRTVQLVGIGGGQKR